MIDMDTYEKKYNEALERAQKTTRAGGDVAMDIVQYIFPELAESEDERIRKWILEKVQEYADSGFPRPDEIQMANKAITYLEKQKEQKPINESNTHEPTLDEARKWNEAYEKGYSLGYKNGRNEQKSVEWSEEDRRHLDRIQMVLESWDSSHTSLAGLPSTIPDDIDWLKSLRPSWKPSEEQKERSHFVRQVLSDGHMKKFIEIYSDECDCEVGDVVKAIIRKKD